MNWKTTLTARALAWCAVGGMQLASAGCASVVSGRRMEVAINSNPPNAHVSIYNQRGEHVASGMTPMATELKRGNGRLGPARYTATIQKPGFQSAQVPLRPSVNPWILGNAVIGGIPGLVIDPVTGAAWNPAPKEVNLHLQPLGPDDGFIAPAAYEEKGQRSEDRGRIQESRVRAQG